MKPVKFFNHLTIEETTGIRSRCDGKYLEEQLCKKFPHEKLRVIEVKVNDTGYYQNPLANAFLEMFASGFKMDGLPPYCEVQLEHVLPGDYVEHVRIWSPLAWNDRFLGTGGGAASTGGLASINRAEDTSRGMTVPNAVYNGFTSATTDSGNVSLMHDWALDPVTNTLDWERIENWRARGTHWMTLLGRHVAEILHKRCVRFSYFHGASGGGRQAMVEAQEFPDDYDGIWASSPSINWSKALLIGLWPIAVMNSYNCHLSPAKLETFRQAVHNHVGGSDAYFRLKQRLTFDPSLVVGEETPNGIITMQDAMVMRKIWDGPQRGNGDQLWYSFRPGGTFWNAQGSPTTAFYYEAGSNQPLVFPFYARWVAQDALRDFLNITKDEFETIYDKSVSLFSGCDASSTNLGRFAAGGGKLILDHGIDDPLIPVEGTIDYYNRLCLFFGDGDLVREFCRLYVNPGDGHAGCTWHGPGLTESVGMRALMDWVENGIMPQMLRGVQIDPATSEAVRKSVLEPV